MFRHSDQHTSLSGGKKIKTATKTTVLGALFEWGSSHAKLNLKSGSQCNIVEIEWVLSRYLGLEVSFFMEGLMLLLWDEFSESKLLKDLISYLDCG